MKDTSYESESMQFIKSMLKKPGMRETQMRLRGTWWDKEPLDLDQQQEFAQAALKHDPYAYFSYPSQKSN
jgi:hypothetical protein